MQDLFRQLHEQLRRTIAAVPEPGLNWAPGDETNTVATLVVHLTGSEAETLRCVAGVPCERDRPAEFVPRAYRREEVVAALDAADALAAELFPLITEERLAAEVTLPTLPDTDMRTGATWLIANYAHAREHLGQLLLTAQLFEQARGRACG